MGGKTVIRSSLGQSATGLVYEVRDAELVVLVVAVGKRESNAVYTAAMKR